MEILIKVIDHAIPTYVTGSFLLSKSICNNMENTTSKYWWGDNKVHLINWNHLGKSNMEGCLGFRTLQDFNEVMLVKQIWRLHIEPNFLVAKTLKFRGFIMKLYYPNYDILNDNLGIRPRYLWRSLHHNIWIIKQGSC